MSQLSKAPLRSAKHLKKVKEIKKVMAAIRWHEKARKRQQQKRADVHDSVVTFKAIRQHEDKSHLKRRALRHAREDWRLGPLRPNRAVGEDTSKYGAIPINEVRGPTIQEKVQQYVNEVRERRGKEPIYPLVVDDKKYFPIVEGDRVVVIRGRDKGRIGTVGRVLAASHEIVVKDLNKVYVDGEAYASSEESEAKREDDAPLPFTDVRLVVPYEITLRNAVGEIEKVYQDVVVDKVVMERHTTGIDPFTQIDHGLQEFPKEHRYDPATGLPIFKRYVAGTKSIIQWPWEFNEEDFTPPRQKSATEPPENARKGKIVRTWYWIKGVPNASARALSKAKQEQEKRDYREELEKWQQEKIETTITDAQNTPHLHARKEAHYSATDGDTTLNLADPSEENRTFYPSLVYPPFPKRLAVELPARKSGRVNTSEAEPPAPHEAAEPKQVGIMKTPMQLRWEVERAKTVKEAKPLVDTNVLLMALGKHMQAKGLTLPPETDQAAGGELHAR